MIDAAGGVSHVMPVYDADVMRAELALLSDWYWPYVTGQPIDVAERAELAAVWAPFLDQVATKPGNAATTAWVLRDFHSPNLLWRPSTTALPASA